MTRLKLFGAALAMSASFAGTAIAADMYDPGSMKDAPEPMPTLVQDWSGFYIGGGVGAGFLNYSGGTNGTFDAATATPLTFDALGLSVDNDQDLFFGTAQIGYDRQLPSDFLIGVFADYDFNNDTETRFSGVTPLTISGAPGDTLSFAGQADIDNTWTIGGRLGYLVNPSLLVYGLVGWTHTDLTVEGTFSTDVVGGTPVSFTAKDDLDALTVGGGVETMLRPGLSLKFEYRYTDLDGLSAATALDLLAGAGSDGAATTNIDTDIHTVRAVLTWRPGM